MRGRGILGFAALFGLWWIGAGPIAAETREVGPGAVQLRSGPGTEFPAAAALAPGEDVEVVESASGWARVKLSDGREGWVGESYLVGGDIAVQPDEIARLRDDLAAAQNENRRLAATAEASQGDGAERTRLAAENAELRGRDSWMQWVAGALIFASGMTLGAILRGVGSRRGAGRLRL